VTPPEAPNDQQIIDVEHYKASEKNSKQQRRSFFVAGDLAHVPNSPKMHFSTSNIPGKGKNSRRFEAMSQAVEKMRIYLLPQASLKTKKRLGAGAPPAGLVGQKPQASASLEWNQQGVFLPLTGIFFHLTGRFFSQAGPFSTTSTDRWRSPWGERPGLAAATASPARAAREAGDS
jgi:hypothetical protein